jgi:hypothetical protein
MAKASTLSGAAIKLYVSGILYPQAQSVTLTIDYGEEPIYGIDSALPQEIRQTRISIQGSVSGVRILTDSGLQTNGIIPILKNSLHAPYISIEIRERESDAVLYFIQGVKVTSESFRAVSKGKIELSFNFKGTMPYQPNDMQYA